MLAPALFFRPRGSGRLTFHGEARLVLELGRVAAVFKVRPEDERDFSYPVVSNVPPSQIPRAGELLCAHSYACRRTSTEA